MKEVKVQTVWEAHKAVLRGNLMTLNGRGKRRTQEKLKNLQEKIKQKEKDKKKLGEKSIMREIRVLQDQIVNFANEIYWNF